MLPDAYKVEILKRALGIACKMLRENPPGQLELYPEKMIPLLIGGNERDPEGKEYVNYFVKEAIKENLKNGKNV